MNDYTLIGIRPIRGCVLLDIYDRGAQTITLRSGFKLWTPSDDYVSDLYKGSAVDMKHPGIRPRWARVLALSEEAMEAGLSLGDDILADQLKWSRGVPYGRLNGQPLLMWRIPVEDIMMARETDRTEYIMDFRRHITKAELFGRD